MDERDLAYLRTVAAVIGQEIEKLAFIEQDLGGARLYACRTVRDDLNAVHTGLKRFIQDRTVPGTIIDPVTHLGTPPAVELTPEEWAMFDDTDPGYGQEETDELEFDQSEKNSPAGW